MLGTQHEPFTSKSRPVFPPHGSPFSCTIDGFDDGLGRLWGALAGEELGVPGDATHSDADADESVPSHRVLHDKRVAAAGCGTVTEAT